MRDLSITIARDTQTDPVNVKDADTTSIVKDTQTDPPENGGFTIPGALHFIEHEMNRYEQERLKWDMDRSMLESQITSLVNEIEGFRDLHFFFINRIKMLECCLRAERKRWLEKDRSESAEEDDDDKTACGDDEEDESGYGNMPVPPIENFAQATRKALYAFVDEFDAIDAFGWDGKQSESVKSRLEEWNRPSWMKQEKQKEEIKKVFEEEDDEEEYNDSEDKENICLDTDAPLVDCFKFLDNESGPKKTFEQLSREYREERERQVAKKREEQEAKDKETVMVEKVEQISDLVLGSVPSARLSKSNAREILDTVLDMGDTDDETVAWNTKKTLRGHMDSVRFVQFHPVDPVLFTASEDATVKMWYLYGTSETTATATAPVCTFRGHSGPVLCLAFEDDGERLCTGGQDGYLTHFKIPPISEYKEIRYEPDFACFSPYEKFSDYEKYEERNQAHDNAIWSVAVASECIISASADGLVKIWKPENEVIDISPPKDVGNPIAALPCLDAGEKIIIAYQKMCVNVVSFSGDLLQTFSFLIMANDTTLTALAVHPTLPYTVVASSDRRISFFDHRDGTLVSSIVAHTNAVSSVAIDSQGLHVLTGCHDGSIRVWDFDRKTCLQEIMAHRTKADAGVYSVAFRPCIQMIASGGADGVAKVLFP